MYRIYLKDGSFYDEVSTMDMKDYLRDLNRGCDSAHILELNTNCGCVAVNKDAIVKIIKL
jgi:hypothetical protein